MTPRDPLLPEPQAFYFGDPGRPLLGCLHRPAHGAAEPAMGVLVCAPLGHEDLATHRALRRWAGALAEAGWPVLRFDYPGAGDSADLPAGALWLEAMLQSVHQAADALRQHSGAPRVVLLGVRVGALLAAQVARQRSDVAALVALLPVASGRAWVRECRLLNGQAMNGQALGGAQVHVGAAGGLDLGGLVLDAEQAASLGSVQAGGPPGSLGCAALVIERDDLAGGRYADDLQGSGAEVVVHPLSGLDRVMAVAHSAWLPTRVDALSVDWLQNLALPATPTLSDATSASPLSWSAPAGLLSFSEGARWIDDPVTGVVLTEQLIRIGRAPALAAVLTRAATDAEAAPDARGLLLLSSGAERRCGPNRLWTRFARQRAARGEVVLRLDLAGIGDSAARPGGTEHDVYDPGCQRDIAAALAWLRSAQGVGPCAVVGICSGAFHAWRAALSGLPVQAVLPVNPLVFHWLPGMSLDPTAHAFGQLGIASDALRLARDPQRWLKLLRGRVNYRVILSALAGRARAGLRQRARGLARGLGVNLRDDLASELRQVARAGVALHFVFSDQEPGRALLLEQGGAVARRLMDGPQLALHAVAGADHTFTRRADREALYAVLDRALSSVPALAPGPAPASLTASPPASLPASSPASPPAPAPPPAAPPPLMTLSADRSRPRIGVDFHTFDGLYQGSRSHLLGLFGEAVALAPEFDFVFLSATPARLAQAHPSFALPHVHCAALPHGGGLARLGWQLGLARRRHRIDLLHVQYRLPLWAGGACACTVHDVLFESHPQFFSPRFVQMARWTSRYSVRRAALLFSVSAYSRDEMARCYGVDPARVDITFNGVDTTRFRPAAAAGSADAAAELAVLQTHGLRSGGYLCSIGRIEPRKNQLGLLQAYARLPQPRPPLILVGQRDFGDAPVFDAARALGSEVRILESVDDAALPVLLRHAMVLAYPSFAEGFGMPVLEALASGVPVLTANNTALPEVAGDAALLADAHDPAAMAVALQTLIADEGLRERLKHRGLARAAAFNWRASAEVLVAAYRRHFAQA